MTKAYLVKVYGRVTGVGFRYSTLRQASLLTSLCGYVRNVASDQVEVLIQGEETELSEMLDWLRSGPSYARVKEVKVNETPVNPRLSAFEIR